MPHGCCRHTSRFLVIWLASMPFTLWKSCGLAMIPATGLIAFLLLGIEEIGVQIEEPFSILPLGQHPASCFHVIPDLHFTVGRTPKCTTHPGLDGLVNVVCNKAGLDDQMRVDKHKMKSGFGVYLSLPEMGGKLLDPAFMGLYAVASRLH